MLNTLIFDLDGTLLDSGKHPSPALEAFSIAKGFASWDHAKLGAHYTDPHHYDLGWGLRLDQQQAVLLEYYQYGIDNFDKFQETYPTAFDGVIDMLNSASHMQLYLATARDRRTTEILLQHNAMDQFFVNRVTTTCVFDVNLQTKPAPDMIYYLAERKGLKTEHAIVIGDTTHDIHMAQNAGLPVIAISHGSHSAERLNAENPDYLVHSVPELKTLIL